MKSEKKLEKANIRTDLAIEKKDGVIDSSYKYKDIKVTRIKLLKTNILSKKEGNYITIEFSDITDFDNFNRVMKYLLKELKIILAKYMKKKSHILTVGLGNPNFTDYSLGPKTIDKILITNHIYKVDKLSKRYRRVSSFNPNVMGNTGLESSDIIYGIVKKVRPNLLIVVDSLVSNSIERMNKTIQITDTGINPGSGVGNDRKEISRNTIGIPVIAIGVPTVIDKGLIMTPKDIDFQIEKLSDLISLTLNKIFMV